MIRSERPDISIAHIIGEYDHDIGLVHIRGYLDATNPINQEKGKKSREGMRKLKLHKLSVGKRMLVAEDMIVTPDLEILSNMDELPM